MHKSTSSGVGGSASSWWKARNRNDRGAPTAGQPDGEARRRAWQGRTGGRAGGRTKPEVVTLSWVVAPRCALQQAPPTPPPRLSSHARRLHRLRIVAPATAVPPLAPAFDRGRVDGFPSVPTVLCRVVRRGPALVFGRCQGRACELRILPKGVAFGDLWISVSSRSAFRVRIGMAEEGGKKMEEGEKMLYKPQSVKLVSAEGFEFVIDRKAAIISNTLRTMLSSSGSFTETELGEVNFPEISTPILEKVCQYFYWSLQFTSGKELEFYIEPEITLELMMAANYLHT